MNQREELAKLLYETQPDKDCDSLWPCEMADYYFQWADRLLPWVEQRVAAERESKVSLHLQPSPRREAQARSGMTNERIQELLKVAKAALPATAGREEVENFLDAFTIPPLRRTVPGVAGRAPR